MIDSLAAGRAVSLTFEYDGQTWQIVEDCKNGVIAVLIVDGRRTQRKGYFPYPLPDKSQKQ
jgi:hypothetical protein